MITTGTILRAILLVVGFIALYVLRDIVLIVLAAVVIASAIEPSAKWLMRYRVPRALAVILIYLLIGAVFATVIFVFLPPVLNEVSRLSDELPRLIAELDVSFPDSAVTQNFFGGVSLDSLIQNLRTALSGVTTGILGTISVVFGGVLSFILISVISFYLAVQERGIENFLRIITPLRYEKEVVSLWRRSQEKIGLWLKGQLVLGLLIGVLVYLGLTILGIRYALILALLAALFEIIPIFGPLLAAVPAVILGFLEGLAPGFMVLGLYVIIQQFENHLIYPLVVTKIVGVPPLLVILALFIGAKLAGFLGILLSIPAAAVFVEIFHDIERGKAAHKMEGDPA